jgi:uncharacterized membrane protein
MMDLAPLMVFHITAGSVALIMGATALLTRKGAWLHRNAGNAFFIAMLLMSIAGGALAILKPAAAAFNMIISAITIYMISTSWVTVTRTERASGAFEVAGLLAALAIAASGMLLGMQATQSPKGVGGIASFLFFAFAAIAAAAAIADLSVILRGGIAGAQRIARHLWRMSFAMFLATLAFFVGQGAKIFPQWIRDTNLLPLPMLIVLALMLYWLWRVLRTNWWSET